MGNGLHFTMEHTKPKKRTLHTVVQYFDALWILLLALAIAGCERVHPRPLDQDGSLRVEMPTDNPHDFTTTPLNRCKSTAGKVHNRDQLFWLKDKDGEERASWAKFFRESEGLIVGFVIDKIWHMRVACWDPHIGGRYSAPASNSVARTERQPKVKRTKRRAGPTGPAGHIEA